MGQSLSIPNIIPNDWKRLDLVIRKIKLHLGSNSNPTFAGLTLTGLTASSLIGANASNVLESVTIGTGLNYTRPTLSLSHLGIQSLTDPGADKILFWDDSETASKWLGVGNSIAITTTTLDTIQDIRTSASPTFVGLTLSGIVAESTDVDKFLVDSSGVIKYRTGAQVLSDIGGQLLDAGLTSLAGLTYVSASFIKLTAEDTYAVRTIAETKTDLSLNLVENTALSTWAGTTNVTTLGTITTGIWTGTTIAIANGGTGQITQQTAINALTAVSGATNEHVLTKDTATGNAIFKSAAAATFISLTDTPANYTGSAGKYAKVNAGETALEFDTPAGGGSFTSKCSVYLSSNQNIADNTLTKVTLQSENYDTDSEYDNTTNYRFTAKVAGYYHVSAAVTYDTLTATRWAQAIVYVNGAFFKRGATTASNTNWACPTISCDVYLAVDGYIELYTIHNNGSTVTITATGNRVFMDIHRFA